MAFLQVQDTEWHDGEQAMQQAMHIPPLDNPTVPALSPQLANHLRIAPLVAIGLVDGQGRPWTTLWGGSGALGGAVAQGVIGIRAPVTPKFDPVVEELYGNAGNKEIVRPEGKGRMISGLTIDLENRKRVKLFGHMIAGALSTAEDEVTETSESIAEAQLVLRIEQSLGNCPKYLNKKHIVRAQAEPELISAATQLPTVAINLLARSDLFFVSSSRKDKDMDTNHRGGPEGFVRVIENSETGAVLCWPEYSGNRFYQTLGNLKINPVAGICVPDFDNGDMLYMTGTTDILVGATAAEVLPKSNLAVKFTVTAARTVRQALPFRGVPGERSPYNPTVRYLSKEKKPAQTQAASSLATLVEQTKITPTISRYLFSLDAPAEYTSGQYVTFDFGSLLNIGYSHMRDDDPRSLNDDFVRTFTVSSSPDPIANGGLQQNEFEITIRHVGAVTEHMAKFSGSNVSKRPALEVDVKGFGGAFQVSQTDENDHVLFIAAGIGITPLLPALHKLDIKRFRLIWTVRAADLPLVSDVLDRHAFLGPVTTIFVTAMPEGETVSDDAIRACGAVVNARRLSRDDVVARASERIFLCTSIPLRKQISTWMPDKELIFEDFNF